jgi:hypothetical protein
MSEALHGIRTRNVGRTGGQPGASAHRGWPGSGPLWRRPFLRWCGCRLIQEHEVVGGAPAPFDQEVGRVVGGAAAPLLLQGVGE